jgi:hypothetical protein
MYPDRRYYVYILASKRNGTLYTGITDDLSCRIFEHKNDILKGSPSATLSILSFGAKCSKTSTRPFGRRNGSSGGAGRGNLR